MSLLIEKILEHLQEGAERVTEFLDAMTSNPRDAWRKTYRAYPQDAIKFKTDWADWYRARQRFSKMLYYLRKEGLVKRKGGRNRREASWVITRRGLTKLENLEKQKENPLSRRHVKEYRKSRQRMLVLVIFDIPERFERKRRWLRETLRWLDFELLQKSVWLGRTALPEEFLKDLRRLELTAYVHILTIHKRGSMHAITG